MIGGQRIQLGLPHAGKTAEVSVEADIYQITVEPGNHHHRGPDHQPRHPAAQGLQLRLIAMDAQVGQSCWQSGHPVDGPLRVTADIAGFVVLGVTR
jgi:hypothetical protein